MNRKMLFPILITTLLVSCSPDNEQSLTSEIKEDNSISKIMKTDSGKTYYSVDNKPITPLGVQIRTDVFLYDEDHEFSYIEEKFEAAKSLGVTMVEIPVPWRACEPSKDSYTFRDLGKMMTLAKNLDLKIEILLFGTNTTGWSGQVPDYIQNDSSTYTRYVSHVSPNSLFLKQDDPELLDREGKWVNAMMDAIASWSASNNNEHIVTAIQIHNESDTFPRFVLNQQQIYLPDDSRRLTDIEAWEETKNAYSYLGKIVKNSSYPCLTRINVAQAYKDAWEEFVPDIFNLEGIDIIGDDIYQQTVSFTKDIIQDFNDDFYFKKNNFPHVSENDGSYGTTPSLILAATALGGGYDIYDLVAPETTSQKGWDDWGIYSLVNGNCVDKTHTDLTRKIIKGIASAGSDFVLADKENIAAFNLKTNVPETNKNQSIQTEHALISFETQTGALGYVITSDSYIDAYFTSDAKITFNNVSLSSTYSTGTVDMNGTFTNNNGGTFTNNVIEVEGGKMYRFTVTHIDATLISNTVRNIG